MNNYKQNELEKINIGNHIYVPSLDLKAEITTIGIDKNGFITLELLDDNKNTHFINQNNEFKICN